MNNFNQQPEAPRQFKNYPLLVIEDNPDQWLLIQRAIQANFVGIKPVWCSTAQAALAYLNDCISIGLRLPFMILLDLYLPDRQTGWQLLEQIKTVLAPVNYIPIVMLSASHQPEDIAQAYDRLVTSYVIKPTTYDEWGACFKDLKEYWWEVATLPLPRNQL